MENKRKNSRKRQAILDALCATKEHPTAEMVYRWLKPENPALSLGTVYRNLNLLADEGVIRRMAFPVERYDAKTAPHPHFCCDQCGGVYDLELPYDPELDRQALLSSGHDVTGHELTFHGLCRKCKPLH